MKLPTRPRISIFTIPAGLVTLAVIVAVVASITLSGNTSTSVAQFDSAGPSVQVSELPSIKLGTPLDDIEQRFGKGTSALAYPETGDAVEPTNAECAYYPQDASNIRNIIQLCYRNDRLVSKRAYAATPGAPLQD